MTWYIASLIGTALLAWVTHRPWMLLLRKSRLYSFIMWYVMPYARISVCHTSMTSEKYVRGWRLLRVGDIILTTDNRALSTLCVPGDHTHALLCTGDLWESTCAQMTHAGYGEVAFAEACFHASRVVVLRCPSFDDDYIAEVVRKTYTFKDTPYDTDFSFDNGKSYCSELIYQADIEKRLRVVSSKAWGTGQMVVTPDDLFAANVEVIYDSDDIEKQG